MMTQWWARLNQRERMLVSLVAGTLFLLVNVFVWSGLLGAIKRAHADLASRSATRKTQSIYLKEQGTWAKRDQWLRTHQPQLKSAVEASTLLDQLKEVAGKYEVLLENPQIGSGDSTPSHQSVFASVETKSPWPPLVHFLYDVQKPDSFVVFENASLAIDTADATMMRGKFKIARWFAPGGTTKK